MRILFVHIPKTAGLSICAALSNHFGAERTMRVGNNEARALFHSMNASQIDQFDCISGHLPLKDFVKKGAAVGRLIFSVLRDPIAKAKSAFDYLRNSDHPDHVDLKFRTPDEFLDYVERTGGANEQCAYLCDREPTADGALAYTRKIGCALFCSVREVEAFMFGAGIARKLERLNVRAGPACEWTEAQLARAGNLYHQDQLLLATVRAS